MPAPGRMPAVRPPQIRRARRHDAFLGPELMKSLPIALAEWVFWLPWMRRPKWLATVADVRPSDEALRPQLVILEIREGHLKWAHLLCPKCGDHIELPLAGR